MASSGHSDLAPQSSDITIYALQYSSSNSTVVDDLSASVMSHTFSPDDNVYAGDLLSPGFLFGWGCSPHRAESFRHFLLLPSASHGRKPTNFGKLGKLWGQETWETWGQTAGSPFVCPPGFFPEETFPGRECRARRAQLQYLRRILCTHFKPTTSPLITT